MTFFFTTIQPFSHYASYKRATGLGEGLALLGHTVYIAALDCEENRELLSFESPHCKPLLFPQMSAVAEFLFKLKTLYRLKPDYVYSPTYGLRNLMGARIAFPRNTRLIQEINELNSIFFPEHRTIWKLLELLGLIEADLQVCASQNLKRHMDLCGQKWRIRTKTLYLPFAYPAYLGNGKPLENSSSKTLVYLGNIVRSYGIFELLGAFKILSSKTESARLIVVGTGPDEKEAQTFVINNGLSSKVKLVGRVKESELNRHLGRADAFVLPLHDTPQDHFRCPSKLYYYLAYGKPIITCRIGDPFDTLGPLGIYYTPSSIPDLAEAMHRALKANASSSPDSFAASHSWLARARKLITHLPLSLPPNQAT